MTRGTISEILGVLARVGASPCEIRGGFCMRLADTGARVGEAETMARGTISEDLGGKDCT